MTELYDLRHALQVFANDNVNTQSQKHIKPLHKYVALRLVLEGGFPPEDIMPRPPIRMSCVGTQKNPKNILEFDAAEETNEEVKVLGGLRPKDVDVVVHKALIGPVVAVSVKGLRNALRNLTNRMEEAPGDCTNIHMSYPNLVYTYLFLLRANSPGAVTPDNAHIFTPDQNGMIKSDDISFKHNKPVPKAHHFATALSRLSGRFDIRDDISKYEAVSINMVEPGGSGPPKVLKSPFAQPNIYSISDMFDMIYKTFDRRYVFVSDVYERRLERKIWASDSPLFSSEDFKNIEIDYRIRETNPQD